MPAPTALLRLATRRAASPALAVRPAAAGPSAPRSFHSASHQDSPSHKLRLQTEEGQAVAPEHDTLHENQEYTEHEKNLVRRRPLSCASERVQV